ncbi:hypothetical protein P171DRAFT_481321 [Karstenula rhodostoma CBS 690.94]|uniref:Uncharacterized protein n=1 Tax=Karstenula rhodostoma CBS 690.94 TaxID=1392251 RepID=A0A9P4UG74_9PLEO|nr:hypothetical protein P171DRAFT_481321 [Karstenula rhodostoma CBS 690.94]
MCTVIYYTFGCGHYVTRCQSRCGGTKVKERQDSRRAACTAVGYVTIKRLSTCSKCSRDSWVSRWQTRLEKAKQFHDELVKDKLPGAPKVSELIKELDKTYELELWELRNTIPYEDRAKIRRVGPAKVKWSKLLPSPLTREVQPEEVVMPVITEPVYIEDDDDWVRSTDPMHPIDTNYELVCAGIDDEYLDFLTGEEPGEIAEPKQDNPNPSATSWDWSDEVKGSTDNPESWNPCSNNNGETSDELEPSAGPMTAWGLTAEDTLSSGEIGIDGLLTQEEKQQGQIQEVIKAFWDVVNITDNDDHPPSTTKLAEGTNINTAAFGSGNTSDLQHLWVDGPSETPLPVQSTQDQPQPNAPHRANSTNTKYDAFRRAIPHLKPSTEYYAQWLVECRLEIREMVGPEGAWIPDPAKPM